MADIGARVAETKELLKTRNLKLLFLELRLLSLNLLLLLSSSLWARGLTCQEDRYTIRSGPFSAAG
jgi:hypothetical protein